MTIFINIPIDIYAEATTKNKLKDMETVRKVVERFGECGYAAVDCENRVDIDTNTKCDRFL